jgi:hypothetical protein
MPQEPVELLQEKEKIISRQLNSRAFKVNCREPQVSCLEGALSRGDRRLSRVLIRAWELGSRFDQWSEQFNFSLWEKAFAESHLNLDFYAHRSIGEKEILPWDHLYSGVLPSFLAKEAARAMEGQLTADCRATSSPDSSDGSSHGSEHGSSYHASHISCQGCGACQGQGIEIPPLPSAINREAVPAPAGQVQDRMRELIGKKVCQIRGKFQKNGLAIYMSHLDLMRVLFRAIRRADLPIAFSQGFHPHPQVSFGPPLPVGVEGLGEYADFVFHRLIEPEEFLARINEQLPEGIRMLQGRRLPLQVRSLSTLINRAIYRIQIPVQAWKPAQTRRDGQAGKPDQAGSSGGDFDHQEHIARFLARDEIWVRKSKKNNERNRESEKNREKEQEQEGDSKKLINIRPLIFDLTFLGNFTLQQPCALRMLLSAGNENVDPALVLESLYGELIDLSSGYPKIIREGLHAFVSGRLWDPIEIS